MERVLTRNIASGREPFDLRAYEAAGGYVGLRRAVRQMTPAEVTAEVKASGLLGRGGAGFSTGLKWSFVPKPEDAAHPTYFVVNADEMEPGTMKDRLLLEGDPHQIVEGALIASWAVQADVAYIFIRREYVHAAALIRSAIAEAEAAGYIGKNVLGSGWSVEMRVHVSAGRYMCGEETGLLNAIEGKRATPRDKPPFPQTNGIWGRSSVVNNVETVANLPHVVQRGADWFLSQSLTGEGGTKLYGASGKVQRPGIWELPMGTPLSKLLFEYAGGMHYGAALRGLLPGGASTAFLSEADLDVAMDFASVAARGSRLGTGTIIVLDDGHCPVGMVLSLLRFFARESCGWCTPCREGLPWIERTLQALEDGEGTPADLEMLRAQAELIVQPGSTFCALAPGAMAPLQSALELFADDFERHVSGGRCPWR